MDPQFSQGQELLSPRRETKMANESIVNHLEKNFSLFAYGQNLFLPPNLAKKNSKLSRKGHSLLSYAKWPTAHWVDQEMGGEAAS